MFSANLPCNMIEMILINDQNLILILRKDDNHTFPLKSRLG